MADNICFADNKLYNTWNGYLRRRFGCKVIKIALNGGFTCPNIDGTKGRGGCTYCSSSGSGDFAGSCFYSIEKQFETVKERMNLKWKSGKYIPYFQAHTNTYAPAEVLREKFEPVLSRDDVVGISIATRADCLESDVMEYLSELNERTYLTVELGLQSIFDKTGERINRCHTYDEFLEGYEALRLRGINICVHLIDGLPDETDEMMIESARAVAQLRPHSVKLHLLHVLKGTVMEQELKDGKLRLLDRDEYIDIIVRQLEVLPPDTVIQRLTGDGGRKDLIGPLWSLKKFEVLNGIDRRLREGNTYQGRLFEPQR
jgi:radical SAM protein (TIGR01212 family)